MSEALVIIPTYNEIENIGKIIDAVMRLSDGFDVLVIDDASPDGTQDAVLSKIEQYPGRVYMETRQGKLGLGTAYIHGFKWALSRQYGYVIEMDADFSHNPDDLPKLYHQCRDHGADIAIGSRYVSGVNVVNWPMRRVLMSYFASMYVRVITRMPLRDSTAGFCMLSRRSTPHAESRQHTVQRICVPDRDEVQELVQEVQNSGSADCVCEQTTRHLQNNSSIFGEAVFGVISLRLKSIFSRKTFTPKSTLFPKLSQRALN